MVGESDTGRNGILQVREHEEAQGLQEKDGTQTLDRGYCYQGNGCHAP